MAGLGLDALLHVLGHDSYTSVCNKPPGGQFTSRVVASKDAPAYAEPLAGDVWFGVNPLRDIPVNDKGVPSGRGTAADVVRLAAVFADLDVKTTGMASYDDASAVISDLSDMLGTRPSIVVATGHGLQPYWPLEDGPQGADAQALLRRWGRLVAHVAEIRGGRVDPVYDLARVLRVPGTMNCKDPDHPIPVVGGAQEGRPLATEELDEALDAYGAVELPGDRDTPGQRVVSDPAGWGWAEETCGYARAMIDAWDSDEPAARHPWLLAQATRIAVAHRNGCFDQPGWADACERLSSRFRRLLWGGQEARKEAPGEIADAFAWGRELAAGMSQDQVAAELGRHSHEKFTELGWDPTGKPPSDSSFPVSASQDAGEQSTVRRLVARKASGFPVRRVRWLWKDRFALGTLALLAGREGLGKSTLAYTVGAQVTRGLLPGEYYGQSRSVLVCANEDSWEHTIAPRLIAAGADLDRVYAVDAVEYEDVYGSPRLPNDNVQMEQIIKDTDAGLLILDPLMSMINGKLDTHRDAEVRMALEPLSRLADRTQIGVFGLIHHNKSGGDDPLNAVMASKAFTAVARSVHTCLPDPSDETLRIFATTKNNLGMDNLPLLGFKIQGFAIDTPDDGTAWTGQLVWTGEVAGNIRDLMKQANDPDRTATQDAADWLDDFLHSRGGTETRADIEKAAKAAGHSVATLQRARVRMRITTRNEGFPRRTWWSLPGVDSPVVSVVSSDETTETTGDAASRARTRAREDQNHETTETTVHSPYPSTSVVQVISPKMSPRAYARACEVCGEPNDDPDALWCRDCLSSARKDIS
jgi:hypothetical protein